MLDAGVPGVMALEEKLLNVLLNFFLNAVYSENDRQHLTQHKVVL